NSSQATLSQGSQVTGRQVCRSQRSLRCIWAETVTWHAACYSYYTPPPPSDRLESTNFLFTTRTPLPLQQSPLLYGFFCSVFNCLAQVHRTTAASTPYIATPAILASSSSTLLQ